MWKVGHNMLQTMTAGFQSPCEDSDVERKYWVKTYLAAAVSIPLRGFRCGKSFFFIFYGMP